MISPAEQAIRIALVILEDERGRIFLQLRSQVEGIANPGKWGLFGGHIEEGELPAEGALREVEEELTARLRPDKLRFIREWEREDSGTRYYLYHYPVSGELDEAQLTEGQRFAAFWPSQILLGVLEGEPVVSYHLEYLSQFWDGN
jgi:8-oxo-dGTP pyrophosphatase MutT (NUDIX family)